MSAAEQTLPVNSRPWWRRSVGRISADFFRLVGTWNDKVPPTFFNRYNQVLLDVFAAMAALYIAYQLRFEGSVPPSQRVLMWSWMLALLISRPLCLWLMGAYSAIWRYFNLSDAATVGFSSIPPTICLLVVRFGLVNKFRMATIPSSVIFIELGLFLVLAFALRSSRRLTFELSHPTAVERRQALLVGTADTIAAALHQVSLARDFRVVGLLVPGAKLRGLRIGGFPVMDEPSALDEFIVRHRVDLVLISDARLDCVAQTVETAAEFGAEVRLLPSATNVLNGDVRVSALPDLELASTGKSSTASGPHPQVVDVFRDKVVLITGAGGSIGSEISRQVAALPVAEIVLLDRDENAIFEIHGELTKIGMQAKFVFIVGDVRDRAQLDKLFGLYRPNIVLHAAAYKHVPIMESNVSEAVLNNVTGTRQLANVASDWGVERFVMISTDKAVKPTSVMGATKRTAEILLQARAVRMSHNARQQQRTRIACVRFGNVVGSRGSVVPIFLRQIAAGGPVTITHEEMTRYFMTIPEAVHLVLQAATLASSGDIYMLDMGDPVRITDLAARLITMSGHQPGKDIEIKFVGARPGEKIHEQLWYEGSSVRPTSFPRVLAVQAREAPESLEVEVQLLEEAALARNDELVLERLHALPIDFQGTRNFPLAVMLNAAGKADRWQSAASGRGTA